MFQINAASSRNLLKYFVHLNTASNSRTCANWFCDSHPLACNYVTNQEYLVGRVKHGRHGYFNNKYNKPHQVVQVESSDSSALNCSLGMYFSSKMYSLCSTFSFVNSRLLLNIWQAFQLRTQVQYEKQ